MAAVAAADIALGLGRIPVVEEDHHNQDHRRNEVELGIEVDLRTEVDLRRSIVVQTFSLIFLVGTEIQVKYKLVRYEGRLVYETNVVER